MSISVVITCHNEERYIEQAIRSVAAQTAFGQIGEIIVVNDGSTDGSLAILRRLAALMPRVLIVTTKGLGLPAARNRALAIAQGEHIAFLDGDDYWGPDKIERQIGAFDRDPAIGIVYGDFMDFTDSDPARMQRISVRRFHARDGLPLAEYFVHDAPVIPSTMLVARKVFETVGMFDEKYRVGEDTDFCLRAAARWRFEYVPGALTFKRRHGRNLTGRLERLLPVAQELTESAIARNPELAPLAGKRMARRYAAAGNDCVVLGEKRKGARYLLHAVRSDPFYWRPYMYALLALVPHRFGPGSRRLAKAVFHGAARASGSS